MVGQRTLSPRCEKLPRRVVRGFDWHYSGGVAHVLGDHAKAMQATNGARI